MKSISSCLLAVALLFILPGCLQTDNKQSLSEAEKIHRQVLTVDTHTDTPLNLGDPSFDIGKRHDPDSSYSRVDLPRMRQGHMDASFFAIFLAQDKRTRQGHRNAKKKTMGLFDDIHQAIAKYPTQAEVATSPSDAYRLEKEDKSAIYIGIENGYALGGNLSNVDTFYNKGARYITLCHTAHNDLCDSSTDQDGPKHNGLSPFGRKVVKRMNNLGMMVDVSHISDKAFYDVIEISRDPVIASHSCAFAVRDHPRNLSDQMLHSLKTNGGVIQICLVSDYLKKPAPQPARDSAFTALRERFNGFENLTPEERAQARKQWRRINQQYPKKLANVEDIVDHIDHVVKTIGIDHVGIGTDFDGGARVNGCRDVREIPNITRELVKRGYTHKEIEKIWGGNFMRVFRQVHASGKKPS